MERVSTHHRYHITTHWGETAYSTSPRRSIQDLNNDTGLTAELHCAILGLSAADTGLLTAALGSGLPLPTDYEDLCKRAHFNWDPQKTLRVRKAFFSVAHHLPNPLWFLRRYGSDLPLSLVWPYFPPPPLGFYYTPDCRDIQPLSVIPDGRSRGAEVGFRWVWPREITEVVWPPVLPDPNEERYAADACLGVFRLYGTYPPAPVNLPFARRPPPGYCYTLDCRSVQALEVQMVPGVGVVPLWPEELEDSEAARMPLGVVTFNEWFPRLEGDDSPFSYRRGPDYVRVCGRPERAGLPRLVLSPVPADVQAAAITERRLAVTSGSDPSDWEVAYSFFFGGSF